MAVKEVIWQDGQGSTPGTNSGDKITLQADAWSGTQQVTVQTPENFGIFRAMNIVFYSSADSTKTATLKVTQEAATASLSPTTVVFQNTDTAAKTITGSTNISTLSRVSIALEGVDATQFTLSEIKRVSKGKYTFTIKPNSVNSGSSSRNCSIRVKVGRLADSIIPVEQLADEVVSTSYSNYRLSDVTYTYNGSIFNDAVNIRASAGTIGIKGTPVRDKRIVYSSGKIETLTENVPDGNTIHYIVLVTTDSSGHRVELVSNVSAAAFKSGISVSVTSLGYNLSQGGVGGFRFGISDTSSGVEPDVVVSGFSVQGNKREGYSNYTSKSFPNRTISANGGDVTGTVSAFGTCRYTSGSTRTENVPMKFELVDPAIWARIQLQIPGTAGTSLSPSSCIVKAKANTSTTISRKVRVSALPRLADGSTGGTEVGYFTVTQSAATPTYNYNLRFENEMNDSIIFKDPSTGEELLNLYGGMIASLNLKNSQLAVEPPLSTTRYNLILSDSNGSRIVGYVISTSAVRINLSNTVVETIANATAAGRRCVITKE